MQNVSLAVAAAAAALFLSEAILVAIRTPSCVRKQVPLALVGFLVLVGLRPFLPPGSGAEDAAAAAAAWAAGAFLLKAGGRRGLAAWTTASVFAVFVLLMARALGYDQTTQFRFLRLFAFAGLSAVPLVMAGLLARGTRSEAAWLTVACACAWLVAQGAAEVMGIEPLISLAMAAALPLCICTGWMVFQDGYPERPAWGGVLPSLKARQSQEPALYTRLLAAEGALAAQERALAAGYLALGAAHEFKNTISMVRLAAQHGLVQADAGIKDRCLRQIVEHTQTARDSAVDILERISSQGEESLEMLDARRDLCGPLRRAAAALRGEGIVVDLRIEDGVLLRACRSDVEQIVLNLVNNAAESYLKAPSEESRTITVIGDTQDELAVIEVRDSAGGVSKELRQRLFSPSVSGTGSTGLGLFLSRNLAMANGGNVDYLPLEGGSSFRLTLPLADASRGAPTSRA